MPSDEGARPRDLMARLLAAAPIPMALNRIESGEILLANALYARLVGLPHAAVAGRSVVEFYRSAEARERVVRTVRAGQALMDLEMDMRKADGTPFSASLSVSPVAFEGETVVFSGVMDITARKEAEARVRTSERLLETVFDVIPQWVYVKDLDSRYVMVNRTMAEAFGVTKEEMLGRRTREFRSSSPVRIGAEAELDAIVEMDRRVFETGAPVEEPAVSFTLKDGGRLVLHVAKFPLLDECGKVVGLVGISQDITARRTAERALEVNEERFRDFAETSADWFWESDAELRYTYLSANIERVMGIPPEAYYGRNRRELMGEAYDPEVWQPLMQILAARQPFRDFTYPRRTASGETRWLNISGRPRFADDGTFLGYRGSGRDITAGMATERELRASRRMLQTILDSLPFWISVRSPEERYQLVNRPMLEAYGKSADELLGRKLGEAVPYSAEVLEALRRATESVFATGRSHELPEVTVQLPDGRESVRRVEHFPLHDDDGAVTGVVSWSEDIAARKRAQDELRQAQKMEAIGQLSGGVAHDFNNILQLIQGYAQLIRAKLGRGQDVQAELEAVSEAAERGGRLTEQLLTFSRRRVYRPRTLDLNVLVREMLKLIGRVMREDIELVVEAGEDLPAVSADPGMVEQVLLNLCINARDAMPNGGRLTLHTQRFTVDAAFRREHPWAQADAYAALLVTDTGVGMSDEVRDRAFEPFFTTKESSKGTGLGLAMAYGIVRQHGGHISVRSRPGQGATFRVYLPAPAEPVPADAQPPSSEAVSAGKETILVAEDEAGVLRMVTDLLTTMGYTVHAATNGQEALNVFRQRQNEIDMVMLDVVMPKLGGRETFERIKRMAPHMPVLFCSGYAANVLDADFLQRHDVRLLHKPYAPDQLFRAVREVLDARPDRRAPC